MKTFHEVRWSSEAARNRPVQNQSSTPRIPGRLSGGSNGVVAPHSTGFPTSGDSVSAGGGSTSAIPCIGAQTATPQKKRKNARAPQN